MLQALNFALFPSVRGEESVVVNCQCRERCREQMFAVFSGVLVTVCVCVCVCSTFPSHVLGGELIQVKGFPPMKATQIIGFRVYIKKRGQIDGSLKIRGYLSSVFIRGGSLCSNCESLYLGSVASVLRSAARHESALFITRVIFA